MFAQTCRQIKKCYLLYQSTKAYYRHWSNKWMLILKNIGEKCYTIYLKRVLIDTSTLTLVQLTSISYFCTNDNYNNHFER